MNSYLFKVRNIEGNLIFGGINADRRETVVNSLKQKGYYIISVKAQNKYFSILRQNKISGIRVSLKDKALFTHQLATLLKAGLRLDIALKTLSKQTPNKRFASVISQIHSDIEQSSTLSEAMSRHPKIFTAVYTAIIKASEEMGSHVETLFMLGKQLKSQASVNARIRGALIYPLFLLFISAVVVFVLTTFVVPKFIELFINTNQAIPLPTRILVKAVNLLRDFWWLYFMVMTGIISVTLTALKNKRVKLYFDGLLLRMPLIGTLNRKLQTAGFSRTLGSLLEGGVKIISAVDITKGTTKNAAFTKEIHRIEEGLLKGFSLAQATSKQRCFSEIVTNMIAVGEDAGTLPEMLGEIADMYDQEYETAINSMTGLLGPVVIVILGLLIGFVVLAILMPIFETSTMAG